MNKSLSHTDVAMSSAMRDVRGAFSGKLRTLLRKAAAQKVETSRRVAGRWGTRWPKGTFTVVEKEEITGVEVRSGRVRSISSAIPVRVRLGAYLRSQHRALLKIGFKCRNYSPASNPVRLRWASRKLRWIQDWGRKEKQEAAYEKKAYGRRRTVRIYHLKLIPDVDVHVVVRHRSLKAVIFIRARISPKIARRLRFHELTVKALEKTIAKAYRGTLG